MLASYILVLVGGAVVDQSRFLLIHRSVMTGPVQLDWPPVSSVLGLQVGATVPACFYLDSGARTWVFVLPKPVLLPDDVFPMPSSDS